MASNLFPKTGFGVPDVCGKIDCACEKHEIDYCPVVALARQILEMVSVENKPPM